VISQEKRSADYTDYRSIICQSPVTCLNDSRPSAHIVPLRLFHGLGHEQRMYFRVTRSATAKARKTHRRL